MTQLLVSVRNVDEAIAAVEGGADIIDVKEPHHGSLGCAAPDVIREIAAALQSIQGVKPPLSLALGELFEWRSGDRDILRRAVQTAAPQFLKLGLAESMASSDAASWITKWQRVRAAISGHCHWVAVAYADHEKAGSPAVDCVLKAAIDTECQVLLIDTHTKDGTSLSDYLTLGELQSIRQQTSEHGLKLALAGRVTLADLPQLLSIQPDIIAVRGAVCNHGDRTATVCRVLVQQFCAAIKQLRYP